MAGGPPAGATFVGAPFVGVPPVGAPPGGAPPLGVPLGRPPLPGPLRAGPSRPPPPSAVASSARDASNSLPPTAAEAAHSSELQCGVCLEPVLAKRGRFGLLEGCEHAFCLGCLKEWRATHAVRPDVARSCPECRAPSHFVVPSMIHFVGERKAALLRVYLSSLRATPCKHFDFGNGTCPFGSSCFYAHTDRAGRRIYVEPRTAHGAKGSTVLQTYNLSDYLFPQAAGGGGEAATRALLDSIPLAPPGPAADGAGTPSAAAASTQESSAP